MIKINPFSRKRNSPKCQCPKCEPHALPVVHELFQYDKVTPPDAVIAVRVFLDVHDIDYDVVDWGCNDQFSFRVYATHAKKCDK